jgi:hypothetical protein
MLQIKSSSHPDEHDRQNLPLSTPPDVVYFRFLQKYSETLMTNQLVQLII